MQPNISRNTKTLIMTMSGMTRASPVAVRLLETVEKVPLLLQAWHFGYDCVCPPRLILAYMASSSFLVSLGMPRFRNEEDFFNGLQV